MTDSKPVTISPTSTGDVVGIATRKAATAVLNAHVSVIKGTAMRKAIGEALTEGGNLGGKERRFVAFATRELSRHLRRINLAATTRGYPMSKVSLPEDQAILRYALWRRDICHAGLEKVLAEVALPGPIRPRGIPDQILRTTLEPQVELDFGADPLDHAANKHSFPTWLAERIAAIAPQGELEPILEALNREPTLTFRVRPLGTRDALVRELAAKGMEVEACAELPDAIQVSDGSRAIFDSRWMKEGRLQVMDLGSQLLAAFCKAQPGQTVVDFCAGAGGKTLALGALMRSEGRLYAFDTNERRLTQFKPRLKRSGLSNVHPQLIDTESDVRVKRLAGKIDRVLVDAPCSGTGTLRRNPDIKWRMKPGAIDELRAKQASILHAAARLPKVGGRLVYATCSLLRTENEGAIEDFLTHHPGWEIVDAPAILRKAGVAFDAQGPHLRLYPHLNGTDGFFAAVLERKA